MFVRLLLVCGFILWCPAVLAGTTNTPPELLSPIIYRGTGEVSATYDVFSGYSDIEENGIDSITIDGGIGAATVLLNGTIITLIPSNPYLATSHSSPYVVLFTVCDDGVPSECASAVMTVFYNDPPSLTLVTANAASGDILVVLFSQFFSSAGVFHGDDTSDGDTDAIASTYVSSSAIGPFSTLAALPGGSVCSVSGTDTSDVTFTASHPNNVVVEVCYVRVCEELPPATVYVCGISTVTITVRPPLVFKDSFEDPE